VWYLTGFHPLGQADTQCQIVSFSFQVLCFNEKLGGSPGSIRVLHTPKKSLENHQKANTFYFHPIPQKLSLVLFLVVYEQL